MSNYFSDTPKLSLISFRKSENSKKGPQPNSLK